MICHIVCIPRSSVEILLPCHTFILHPVKFVGANHWHISNLTYTNYYFTQGMYYLKLLWRVF